MMTVQCCKCKKVLAQGLWTAPRTSPTGPVTHTYCPECQLATRLEFFTAEASQVRRAGAAFVSELLQDLAAPV